MRRSRALLAVSTALALLFSVATVGHAGGNGKALGTVKPYKLQMQALQDKSGETELQLNVSSDMGAIPVPEALKHVQLKSYTHTGKLAYTKNLKDVPSPGGHAVIYLDDVQRLQPLEVTALGQTSQTVNTEHIESGEVKVLLRPDLTLDSVTAPTQVAAGTPFQVQVLVRERNGDVGASASVELFRGNSRLGSHSVFLEKGEAKPLQFQLNLQQPGAYAFQVRITNVAPGDYDDANNTRMFNVSVASPTPGNPGDGGPGTGDPGTGGPGTGGPGTDPGNGGGDPPPPPPVVYKEVRYQSGYVNEASSSNFDYFYPGVPEPDTDRRSVATENFWLWSYSPDFITSPGTFTIRIQAEDGTKKQRTYTIPGPGFHSNGDGYFWMEVRADGTYFGIQSDASSQSQTRVTNGVTETSGSHQGQFVAAQDSVAVEFDLTVGNVHYGGSYSLDLTTQSTPWDYWTEDWDGASMHSWGQVTTSEGEGFGTTEW